MRLFNNSKSLTIFYYLLIFLISLNFQVLAQRTGQIFSRNYLPHTYKAAAQNWEIVQDVQGNLYFANDKGILVYDGKNWTLYVTKNESPVRSLAYSPQENRVYVGASADFGYLEHTKNGGLKYISLVQYLLPQYHNFEDIWSTHATQDGIVFQTDKYIFLYHASTKRFDVFEVESKESSFFLTFYAQRNLFVLDMSKGLMILKNQKMTLAKEGSFFKNKKIYVLLPLKENEFLIGIRNEGLFLYKPNENKIIEPFKTEADDFLQKHQIYSGLTISAEDFLIGTRTGGAILISREGKIKEFLNKEKGLADNNIRFMLLSQDHTLWLALNHGITKINIFSPWRFWNENNGISGLIRDILYQEDRIWVASSVGIFCKKNNENQFSKIEGIETEAWSLLGLPSGEILAGTNEGVFEVSKIKANLILKTRPKAVLKLYYSTKTEKIFIGLKGGLIQINSKLNDLSPKEFDFCKEEIYSIAEFQYKGQKSLFLGTFVKGIFEIEFDKNNEPKPQTYKNYGLKEGLPSLRDNRLLVDKQNNLVCATNKGLYEYQPTEMRFVPTGKWGENWADETFKLKNLHQYNGSYFVAGDDQLQFPITEISRNSKNELVQQDVWYRLLPDFAELVIYPQSSQKVWIGSSEGVFYLDKTTFKYLPRPLKPYLNKIWLGDSLLYAGFGKMPKAKLSVEEAKEITFEFTSPIFEDENRLLYAYSLASKVDLNPIWRNWDKETQVRFTNLPEGKYIFWVKVKDLYGQESAPISYEFEILPPWYRSIYAYFLYGFLIIFLGVLIVKIAIYNSQEQRKKLQKLVKLRTEEIERKNIELLNKNEEIKNANDEIIYQNKEIRASIDYASRIQRAMLPTIDAINNAFNDNFVMYNPKDGVSGDFYWFSQTNMRPRFVKMPHIQHGKVSVFKDFLMGKKIICAVDCTGHGVPGALISLVGDAFLDEIVDIEGISQPHLILKELDIRIKKALKQDENKITDGMDMAICVIDENNKTLEYAGANRPLIYIQNNELFYIKGERHGIGGYQFEVFEDEIPEEKHFQRHIIDISTTTCFYIGSDGFEDQFGGEKGRKFSSRRLKEILLEYHHLPMQDQKIMFEKILLEWQGNVGQIDDILLIGVRV